MCSCSKKKSTKQNIIQIKRKVKSKITKNRSNRIQFERENYFHAMMVSSITFEFSHKRQYTVNIEKHEKREKEWKKKDDDDKWT